MSQKIKSNQYEFSTINNVELKSSIKEKGYAVIDGVNDTQLEELDKLYRDNHKFNKTGMFYSVYADDLAYRRKIYDNINKILEPVFDTFFKKYKTVYSIYILKAPGKRSEFYLHRDPTCVNELHYQPLHVWIPLVDIDASNGAVCIVEKSNKISPLFRGITIPDNALNYQDVVRQYMEPVFMKKGQMMVFDPRLLHSSMPNLSDKTRPAVVCALVPKEADIVVAHSEEDNPSLIELFKQDEDFFLKSTDFYTSCQCRPETGFVISEIDSNQNPKVSAKEFEQFCKENNVTIKNSVPSFGNEKCIMHNTPVQNSKSKLKTILNGKIGDALGLE